MAEWFWAAGTTRTGGGTEDLDGIDGNELDDLNTGFVVTADGLYVYSLDDDSGAAESDPDVISPDSNAGTKRWVLVNPRFPSSGLKLLDTDKSHDLTIVPGSDLSANRTLTLTTGDASRTVTLSGDPTLDDWFDQSVKQADSPIFAGVTVNNTGLHILDTNASHDLIIAPGSDVTADRTLTLTTGDSDRTVTLSGDPTLDDWFDQSVKVADSPEFGNLVITSTGDIRPSADATNAINISQADGTDFVTFDTTNKQVVIGDVPAGATGKLMIMGEGTSEPGAYTSRFFYAGTYSHGAIFFFSRAKGTAASPTAVGNNDALGSFIFSGRQSNWNNYGAAIQAYVDGTPGQGDMPGRLVFGTTADGANWPTARMTIRSTGNVGIATTGPDRRLDVLDASNPQLRLTHTDGSVYVDLQGDANGNLAITGSGGNIVFPSTGDIRPSADATNAINIAQADGTDFVTYDTTNKRVGIGTAAPVYSFDMVGTFSSRYAAGSAVGRFTKSTVAGNAYIQMTNGSAVEKIYLNTGGVSYFSGGNVGINTTGPDRKLDVLDASNPQLRLTHTDGSVFADFQVDSNHDLTIKPSSTGQVIFQPTTDSTDFFQVLDADGGTPIFNVDAVNERVGVGIALPLSDLHVASADPTLRVESDTSSGNAPDIILINTIDAKYGALRYNPTDQAFEFAPQGSTKMVIRATGNVGINTTGPDRKLDVLDASNPQVRLTHSGGTVYVDLQAESDGDLSIEPSGSNINIIDKDILLGTTTGSKLGTAAAQKIGFWGVTPVIQQAHIIDADGQLADITAKFNTLLSQLEATGILAAA